MSKSIRGNVYNIGILCVLLIGIISFSSCSKSALMLDENDVFQNPAISQPGDTTRPTVLSVNPADASTSVSISNPNISAVFSEAMDSASISSNNFILATQAGAPIAGIVTYDSANRKAIFSPSANLSYSTVYRVTIKAGARDIAKNTLTAEKNWTFTTLAAPAAQDTTPPSISSVYPANGAMSVYIDAVIFGEFSEDMDTATITADNFTLVSQGINIEGEVTYEGGSNNGIAPFVAIFRPKSQLSYLRQYIATIKTGVKDRAGNQMQSVKSWVFTTEPEPVPVVPPNSDTTAPTISRVNPADGATSVSISGPNIFADFSESMNSDTISTSSFTLEGPLGATIGGTVVYDTYIKTAHFTPSSSLSYSTVYTVKVKTSVKDSAGNAMAAQKTWSFTTIAAPDVIPPTIVAVTPTNGATGVSTTTPNVTATFSESMESLSTNGSITLTGPSGPIAFRVKGYDPTNKTVQFLPPDLSSFTTYTVTVDATAKDLAGNNLAAPYTWSFVTGANPGVFLISSEAFVWGGNIPIKYSSVALGSNTSVPLHWVGIPEGTQSLLLVMSTDYNTTPPFLLHWIVKNIPVSVSSFAEGASSTGLPTGCVQVETTNGGGADYRGPFPPKNSQYTYWFELYALNVSSISPSYANTYEEFMAIVGPNIINATQLTGKFTW